MNLPHHVVEMAVETYAELSGIDKKEIAKECLNNPDGQIAKNVTMLMFAAL
jgi:hypothetical protein